MTLVSNVIDEKGMAKLESSREEIYRLRSILNTYFVGMRAAVVKSRAMLAIFNGRIDVINFELAEKIVDKAEQDLSGIFSDLKFLDTTLKSIESIKSKVDQGNRVETKIASIEKFLQSDMGGESTNSIVIQEKFEKLGIEAKTLQHSVQALLELKTGR